MKWPSIGMLAALLFATPALATETVNYTYDAHGRLVTATHTGTINNGQTTAIAYDGADNRTSYAVTNMTLSISGASANEGSPLVFTVTRSGSTTSAASVAWATSNGTAIAGTNYTTSSGTVNFAAGDTSAIISVPTIHDNIATSNLTMTVTLSSPSAGAALGTASATGTINNTDAAASLAIAPASGNEGLPLTFTVTRSGNTVPAVSAQWATSNGTAIAGTNYTASSGTVSFAAGATSATIAVPTIDDQVATSNLTMTTTLSSPSAGATLGTASATGTINNIDTTWSSTLTAGTINGRSGYDSSTQMGSMTNTSFNGFTITRLYSLNNTVYFYLSGSTTPPNSGWTSITVPGVGLLQRSNASYRTAPSLAIWEWHLGSAILTSGTVTIQ